MNNHFRFILILLILFATSYIALAAEIDLLGLTLDVKESGLDVNDVNISVEIYDATTGGNLIYNSSNDNTNKISRPRYG